MIMTRLWLPKPGEKQQGRECFKKEGKAVQCDAFAVEAEQGET